MTNAVGTNLSVQGVIFDDTNTISCFGLTYPKINWAFQSIHGEFGLIQWTDGTTTLGWGMSHITVPFFAPTIAWTSAGLSITLVVLALLARRRWRRTPAAR